MNDNISMSGKKEKESKRIKGMKNYIRRFMGFKVLKVSRKKLKIVGYIISPILFLSLVLFFLVLILFINARNVKVSIDGVAIAAQEQDLAKIKEELESTKKALSSFQKSYRAISWLKILPILGTFISDGESALNAIQPGFEAVDIVIEAIEPYADIIGFKNGEGSAPTTAAETTEDRIEFVTKTIPHIIPRLDELGEKAIEIQEDFAHIDPYDYPKEIFGVKIRKAVMQGLDIVDAGVNFITTGGPLMEVAPYLMGIDEPRTYFILFQNNKELRPTGGFMTAYTIATVDKAKFQPFDSSDIYELDENYEPSVEAPEPIIKYLKGPYLLSEKLRLRDSNWSPDFSESMEFFAKEAKLAGIEGIDGIIAVDMEILVNLLDVLGPIGVPEFGDFSTDIIPECECPQVVYELESFADTEGPIVWSENEPGKIIYAPPNYDARKRIIGPLMNSILANTLGQSKEKIPALFEAAIRSLKEKHVLLFLLDEKAQKAAEEFGIAGTIDNYDGDYLHINDANLGGRKSNLYVTHEIVQDINIAEDGTVEKTVEITYRNPQAYDGWLNSVLPNWVRIYVPKDSELISLKGLEDVKDPYEELGKTVYSGYFELRPLGVTKVIVKYKLPFKVQEEYKLFIQKQPGKLAPLHLINLGKESRELLLTEDGEVRFDI